jgi:hypothetical protein
MTPDALAATLADSAPVLWMLAALMVAVAAVLAGLGRVK